MCKNKEAHNFWSLLKLISKLIKDEVTTPFGRVNLVSDLVLAAVVVAIFTVDTIERIAITVVSIWNQKIMEYLSNADTLIAFIILIVFFAVCLLFLFLSEKFLRKTKP